MEFDEKGIYRSEKKKLQGYKNRGIRGHQIVHKKRQKRDKNKLTQLRLLIPLGDLSGNSIYQETPGS